MHTFPPTGQISRTLVAKALQNMAPNPKDQGKEVDGVTYHGKNNVTDVSPAWQTGVKTAARDACEAVYQLLQTYEPARRNLS